MATLYYNAAVDTNWATLGNWWTDSMFTVPASSLPTSSDDVNLYGSVESNSGSTPTVNSMTNYGYVTYININCVTFCHYRDYASLQDGTVTAASGLFGVTGDTNAVIYGIFNGITYLYSTAHIRGTVNGTTHFYDSSYIYSGGTLNGSGIFYGSDASNHDIQYPATINGNASGTFMNHGIINGNCVMLNNSTNYTGGAVINGSGIFYNTSVNVGDINYKGTFYNSSINGGNIYGGAEFNDSSRNVNDGNSLFGSVNTSNAIFNNSSYNDGGYVGGTATFNNTSFNAGTVAGLSTFNNSSYNSLSMSLPLGGRCNGGATFNHDSYQDWAGGYYQTQFLPEVQGTATFRDRSVNKGGCTGTVIFAHGKGVNGSSILGIV